MVDIDVFLVCGGCGRLISHAHNNVSLVYQKIRGKECSLGSIQYRFTSYTNKIVTRKVIDNRKDSNPVMYHYK